MADRIEREIEEILAKLEEPLPGEGSERKPVSILSAKKQRQSNPVKPPTASAARTALLNRVDPPTLMLAGAGVMVAGLVLASFVSPLIWLSFAGVLLFLGAFVLSFFRSGAQRGGGEGAKGVYWRDRYIEYAPTASGRVDRLLRRFRRRG
jgi:hypothetical protein